MCFSLTKAAGSLIAITMRKMDEKTMKIKLKKINILLDKIRNSGLFFIKSINQINTIIMDIKIIGSIKYSRRLLENSYIVIRSISVIFYQVRIGLTETFAGTLYENPKPGPPPNSYVYKAPPVSSGDVIELLTPINRMSDSQPDEF